MMRLQIKATKLFTKREFYIMSLLVVLLHEERSLAVTMACVVVHGDKSTNHQFSTLLTRDESAQFQSSIQRFPGN